MQKLLIATLMLIVIQTAYSQPLPTAPVKKPVSNKPAPKQPKPDAAPATTKSVEPAQADYNTQTIKFLPDAECDLLIDGEKKGHIMPNTVLKIKLGKGQYLLQAIGSNGADQVKETFTVNEIGSERLYQINLQAITDKRIATEQENKQGLPLIEKMQNIL